ncbi:oxygen-dependent tRNA uridine(34) hydroxylase TrhO [Jannaschia donghaensis]|uniref:tRNA uridine(34) hydroxylase n=1 Tax=Jannaschia donghaensis TaxID=420998 RepID=A0A0M6YIQ3_9RHOB|nr:rhodanese-related sulfurtransferase [Jannaschia donghaensis]CTQ49830.1 putative rhodanese-related sulfurtransferase [Jannaschia donghaensis]
MFTVAAFYRFTPLPDPAALRVPLLDLCLARGVAGTILLAPEGINGTIAGPRAGIAAVVAHLRALPDCADLEPKYAPAQEMPFGKMKVRLKREIVTMGQPDIDPRAGTGRYVTPQDWNAVVADPETVVIDTRNDYEVAIGTFHGAVDPQTQAFGEFPVWWAQNADRLAGKRIAMFCTGGIRCEKSTAYLRQQGVEDVVHLQGGILKYLEDVPEGESLWQGACFVFDDRVSVGHGLVPGDHVLCHACRRPLAADDTGRPEYEAGVQCHRCVSQFDNGDRARFRERMKQIGLARARGARHLG